MPYNTRNRIDSTDIVRNMLATTRPWAIPCNCVVASKHVYIVCVSPCCQIIAGPEPQYAGSADCGCNPVADLFNQRDCIQSRHTDCRRAKSPIPAVTDTGDYLSPYHQHKHCTQCVGHGSPTGNPVHLPRHNTPRLQHVCIAML